MKNIQIYTNIQADWECTVERPTQFCYDICSEIKIGNVALVTIWNKISVILKY